MNADVKRLIRCVVYTISLLFGLIISCGWTPYKTLGSYDLLSGHAMSIARMISNGGFYNTIYDFFISGGTEVSPLTGILPIQELLLIFPFSSFTIVSITVFIILLLNALIVRSLIGELYKYIFKEELSLNYYSEIILALTILFLPTMGWRITHGHINILNGILAYSISILIPLKILNRSYNPLSFLLIVLSLTHLLPFSSFQMILYGVFFALPVWGYLIFKIIKERNFSQLKWGVGTIAAALIICLPVIYLILTYFLTGESQRGIGDKKIFSYLPPLMEYFYTSLSLSRDYIPARFPPFSHHEINYPMGYLLLSLSFVGTFKAIKDKISLIYPVLITNFLIIMFSFNLFGMADILINIVPILKAFRVPYRCLIFFNLNMLIVVLIFLLRNIKDIGKVEVISVGIFVLISNLVPVSYLDSISIMILTISAFSHFKLKVFNAPVVLLCLMAILHVRTFGDRANRFEPIDMMSKQIDGLKKQKNLSGTKLFKTLNFVSLSNMGGNGALFADISVVNSYWHPNKLFNEMYSNVFNIPFDSSRLSFKVDIKHKDFSVFKYLYAVRNVLYSPKEAKGQIKLMTFSDVKNVWSPLEIVKKENGKDIITTFKSYGQRMVNLLDEKVFVTKNISSNLKFFQKCQTPEVVGVFKGMLKVKLNKSEKCLIVLPVNYSKYLVAHSNESNKLETFVANSSQLGIVVPRDITGISIKGEMNSPLIFIISKYLLSLLLIFLLFQRVFIAFRVSKLATNLENEDINKAKVKYKSNKDKTKKTKNKRK